MKSLSFLSAILLMHLLSSASSAQEPVRLLVRSDDMGVSYDVVQAMIKAYNEDILTSASLMPNSAFFEEAVSLCKENPDPEEIEREIRAQIGKARVNGLHFVYLDWHRGVTRETEEIIIRICSEQQLIYGQVTDASGIL